MPHDAMNSQTELRAPNYFRYMGNVVASNEYMASFGVTMYPASTSNPKVLGYRPPANYYHTVGRWHTSGGLIEWFNPTTHETASASGQISDFTINQIWPLTNLDPNFTNGVLCTVLSEMLEDDVAFNAFLLQGKQSLKMVADLATGIAHGTDRLMTAEFKQPKSFRKFLASAGDEAVSNFSGKYLEYLYGWKPLADDVENAFQSMIDGYTGPEQKRFRLKVRKSKRLKSQHKIAVNATTYFFAPFVWEQTLFKELRTKVVLHYEFPSQAGEMLPTMTPFGTAWEAAPWSFVVDWFIPIGDWVGAMEATQYAVYMRDAILTQSVEVASQKSSPSYWTYIAPAAGTNIYPGTPPLVSGKIFGMIREVLSPSAVLDRIRFPDFSSKFGLPQASQALALLSQVLNKWF
jgi:hypothetical protein